MPCKKQEPPRGSMIHIRIDEATHRKLEIRVAQAGTTIQHMVADLIRREVGKSTGLRKTTSNGKFVFISKLVGPISLRYHIEGKAD